MLRKCTLDGGFICLAALPVCNVESIVVYRWDAMHGKWIGEFLYEKKIEKMQPTHVRGLRTCTPDDIAKILTSGEESSNEREVRSRQIREECGSKVRFEAHLKRARATFLTKEEIAKWPALKSRRCPACLQANPAACSKCLVCHVTYYLSCESEEKPEATRVKYQGAPYDLDDNLILPHELREHGFAIVPKQSMEPVSLMYGLPKFNAEKAIGARNRLGLIEHKVWDEQYLGNFLQRYFGHNNKNSWPYAAEFFFKARLQEAEVKFSDIFEDRHSEPPPDKLGNGSLEHHDCGDCDVYAIRRKRHGIELPFLVPRADRAHNPIPKWVRGWHGTSAYAAFSILIEEHLRASVGRQRDYPTVDLYRDSDAHKAESHNPWMPLFNDG